MIKLDFRKTSIALVSLTIFAIMFLAISGTSTVFSEDPSGLTTIESNDVLVGQTGTWTSQNAAEASGGSYLYSSGDEDDSLSLDFYGSTLIIDYVSHPTFGTFAIEVDNNILRTVLSTSEETTFGQQAVIDYLEDEPHTLRIFGVEGIVAIDAITTQLPPPAPANERAEAGVLEAGVPEAITCTPDQFPIRASIADGEDTVGLSNNPSLSGDGRYVAFTSSANNLVTGDTNNRTDIFVYDRLLCIMSRVSVDSAGVQGNDHSSNPSISQYGRYVAFESSATNLLGAGNDTNGFTDIFVHDRQTGTTTRVSVSTAGTAGTGNSTNASISNDGQKIAFQSTASNLLAGGDTNGSIDIFVHDLGADTTIRASVSSGSIAGNNDSTNPAISGNGQFVAFESAATNLVSPDTSSFIEIFVRDLSGNTTTRSSAVSGTTEIGDADALSPDISNDGRYVVYETDSELIGVPDGYTNEVVDIYLHDRNLNTTTRVSIDGSTEADDSSNGASISGNGLYVSFFSLATNLLGAGNDTNNDIDVFVVELSSGTIVRANLLAGGVVPPANSGPSVFSSLSDSGRNIAIETYVDLTADSSDNNSIEDIYVADIAFSTAPSDLIATAVSDEEIDLHWNDNTTNEVSFRLERSLNGTSGWIEFQSIAADFRDWTDNGLNCETTYYYRVRAELPGSTFTAYSNISSDKTQLCPMSPPSSFQITATGQSNIDFSWVDESATETEFRLDISTNGIDWNDPNSPIATIESNVTSFTLGNLDCTTTYHFRIRAYRASDGNLTDPSNEDSTTTLVCTDPGETSLIAPSGNSAIGIPTFQFSEPRVVTYVNIQVFQAGTANRIDNHYYQLFTQAPCSGGVCSVTDPGLLSFQEGQYDWCILTIDTNVSPPVYYSGDPNVCSTGKMTFGVVPPVPTSPIGITLDKFYDTDFEWIESPGITYYKLEVQTSAQVPVFESWYEAAPICDGTDCTVTVAKRLPANGNYRWRIRVWSSNGYGPYSAWVTFTVSVAHPGQTQGMTVQTNGSDVPTSFEWTKDGNVSWYHLVVSGPGGTWINQWFLADTYCGATTCVIPTTLGFVEGPYTWFVGAFSPTAVEVWSVGAPLTVTIIDPLVPDNLIVAAAPNGYPTLLSWNDDAHTTWFNVLIQDQYNATWLNAWYDKSHPDLSCNGTTCQLTLKIVLPDRTYGWWVQAVGPGGSRWSTPQNFGVSVGLPNMPTGLSETDNAVGMPTMLHWNDDSKATWFNVLIQDQANATWLNAWYQKDNSAVSCNGATCQLPISIIFPNNTYGWWVQASGPGGTRWSNPTNFVVGVGAPNIPTNLQTEVGLQSVRFQWSDDNKANWFNLIVTQQSSGTWVNAWYLKSNPAMTCNGTTCEVTINMGFWETTYHWRVHALGGGGEAWSPAGATTFAVSYPDGVTPAGLSETIDVGTGMPTALTWNKDDAVTNYQLFLVGTSPSSAGTWLNAWYIPSAVCNDTTCSVSITHLPFVAGGYQWYVNSLAPGGGGGWSAPKNYTISNVTLPAPSLELPADDAFFATNNVQLQWTSVNQADWYVVEIKGSTGQVYSTHWFAASACNVSSCIGNVVLSNELLIGATWRVRGYRNFGSVFGNWSVSRNISILD